MKITNFATAFSLVSVAIGAALDSTALTPGVAIHANGAPVAQSLSITAEPVTSAKRDVEKRATGHLFVCTDANFKGQCVNIECQTGTCCKTATIVMSRQEDSAHNIPDNLNSPYQDSISSLGPDGYSRTIWVHVVDQAIYAWPIC
ncbi:hypothetical protein IQ06DRAFT_223155 [Phaeosphaeriaceae sp. SRC1lsM3a]|nr:hypothetical protein IQ06DRAFT_223155 [Stagonospora sp. SRC1lsM3a]